MDASSRSHRDACNRRPFIAVSRSSCARRPSRRPRSTESTTGADQCVGDFAGDGAIFDDARQAGLRFAWIPVPSGSCPDRALRRLVPFLRCSVMAAPRSGGSAEGAAYLSLLPIDPRQNRVLSQRSPPSSSTAGRPFLASRPRRACRYPQCRRYTLNSIASVVIGGNLAARRYRQCHRLDLRAMILRVISFFFASSTSPPVAADRWSKALTCMAKSSVASAGVRAPEPLELFR